MSGYKRILLLVLIMAVVVVATTGVTLTLLYDTAVEEQRARLTETVKSQARLIEAVARFDSQFSQYDHPEGGAAATISQIKDAHENFRGFGETGEFTLARRQGEMIVFILKHRHQVVVEPKPVPFDSDLAEPMRRALLGWSGSIVGLDYRGETVLAAYEPVAVLKLGVVAKIDLAEIRAPFIRAGTVVGVIAFLIAMVGTGFFFLVADPMVRPIEESEDRDTRTRSTPESTSGFDAATITDSVYRRKFLVRFFVLSTSIVAAILVVGLIALRIHLDVKATETVVKHETLVKLAKNLLQHDFETVLSDLFFLANEDNVRLFLDSENALPGMRRAVGKEFLNLSSTKRLYDQIRLIGVNGMERVRVNFNRGRPAIVPDSQLQNKDHRYYFKETISLSKGQYYISPIDLNIEGGQIETPFKPMVRFGMPVFDSSGDLSGVVILNYLGEIVLKQFRELMSGAYKSGVLLNADGYWLSSSNPNDEWGFMLGHDRTFGKRYPEVWKAIAKEESGQADIPEGMFMFTTINPLKDMPVYGDEPYNIGAWMRNWKIISVATFDDLSLRVFWEHLIEIYPLSFLILLSVLGCGFWAKALADKDLAQYQLRLANDGLEKEVQERTRELRDEISVRKEAKEEIRKLNAELEKRVIERTAELSAVNRELEAFGYSVSHDLRAPLRGMDGFSHALLKDYGDKLDAEGRGYLQRMRAASQKMAQLIDDLLKLSRVTRGEHERRKVDLSKLAQAVAVELRQTTPERQVTFGIAPGVTAEGDARMIRIAFENLLGNAWKFTAKHDHATIEFGVADQDGKAAYFVRDDGAGFDMAYADKLFQPFQRLHSDAEFGGTGIGLATVARIVHRHGGRVWAESGVEQGTTVYFTL